MRLKEAKVCAVVACVVLWSVPAEAIRWDFDDGTTQGWAAKEDLTWGGPRELHLFSGEVEDGVWRVSVAPSVTQGRYSEPSVELISSAIGYDSALFDQVRIRFRTVHHSPTFGSVGLAWTNEHNARSSGWDPADLFEFEESRFAIYHHDLVVYTTEWQEVAISLDGQEEKIWDGLLKDIRLSFSLDVAEDVSAFDTVEWFEVDWIELTGVEELLEGELPPPYVEYFRFAGGLFAAPIFYPIALGIGSGLVFGGAQTGVLTDLDGDGDLDLFALWQYAPTAEELEEVDESYKVGWLMAVNDGHGGLEQVRIEQIEGTGGPSTNEETVETTVAGVLLGVIGADLTGDGQDEIVLYENNAGQATEVWSIDAELQVKVLVEIADRWIVDAADWDGDGRAELFVGGGAGNMLEVWDVAQGVWVSEEVGAVQNHLPGAIDDFTGDGVLDVLWLPLFGRASTWIVDDLGEEFQGRAIFEFDEWRSLLGVGDFDGDGQVDFLTEFLLDQIEGSKGLAVQSQRAGERVEEVVLYDDRLFRLSPVLVRDLNGDGIDDWVFVGGDRASGVGVFVEWGGGVQPTQAGERHRLEGPGTFALSGDMDGDGDLDLVVLDPILGGVHLLKSSLSEQPTAVLTPAAARPVQHRLGDSYPNPFNPAVVLPLDLATGAGVVSLTVYDVLGRRVRQVWEGPLAAGSYRFVWDGRDEGGKSVAAGVYIYQVEVDGWVEAKKATKLP